MERMRKQFYKCLLFITVLIAGTQMAQAQQKIGTNPGSLEPSAVLELGSSDAAGSKKGFLGPRVNLPSATTYSLGPVGTAAVDGMIVYAIGASGLPAGYYVWQNSKWNLIQAGVAAVTNSLTNTGTATAPILTSNVNGVTSNYTLPIANGSTTGLLSNADYATFNGKENALTFGNGVTRSANAISLGGSITAATTLTLGTNNLTVNAAGTGQLIVSGPTGNTAGLRLSNLTGTATAGTVGQKVLSVDASGNVVLVSDFGAAATATTNTLANTGTAAAPTLTSTVNGVAAAITLPTASATNTGLLSNTAFQTFNNKENALTFSNGLTRTGNTIELGGTLTDSTFINQGSFRMQFSGSGTLTKYSGSLTVPSLFTMGRTGEELMMGVAGGNNQGFNNTTAGDMWLRGKGNVFIGSTTVSDLNLRTNNTNRMSIDGNGVVTVNNLAGTGTRFVKSSSTGVLSASAFELTDLPAGTAGQTVQMVGTTPTWVTPTAANTQNIYTANGTLTSPRTVDMNSNTLTFDTGVGTISFSRGHFATNARISANDTLEFQTSGSSVNQLALLPNGYVSIGSYGTTTRPQPTSILDVNGSTSHTIKTITAATSLGASDYMIIANATTAGFAITLPAPSTCSGRIYKIRKNDETSNAITFTFTGISGSNAIKISETSYINSLNYLKTLNIQSDGTNWQLVD